MYWTSPSSSFVNLCFARSSKNFSLHTPRSFCGGVVFVHYCYPLLPLTLSFVTSTTGKNSLKGYPKMAVRAQFESSNEYVTPRTSLPWRVKNPQRELQLKCNFQGRSIRHSHKLLLPCGHWGLGELLQVHRLIREDPALCDFMEAALGICQEQARF
jgi:hypothetical protein